MTDILHPKFKGAPTTRQQTRSKERRGNVDTNKCDMGGDKGFAYYKDMPGVHIDEHNNRQMITFIVKPDGECTAIMHAHNVLISRCIDSALENRMLRGIVQSAVFNHAFKNKTPLNFVIRKVYAFKMFIQAFKHERKKRKAIKEFNKRMTTHGE
jgi:hypothetical protein